MCCVLCVVCDLCPVVLCVVCCYSRFSVVCCVLCCSCVLLLKSLLLLRPQSDVALLCPSDLEEDCAYMQARKKQPVCSLVISLNLYSVLSLFHYLSFLHCYVVCFFVDNDDNDIDDNNDNDTDDKNDNDIESTDEDNNDNDIDDAR